MTPWCTSCAALQLVAPARRQRTCRRCRAAPHSALLTVHRALSSGYPLETLRLATSGATAPLFSVRRLEALVRSQPHLFDPVRARADAATLRRERRAALPEMDAFRARILHTGVPAAFCVGAHVDAVARGVLSARRAVRIAAAGAAASRCICGTLAPHLPRCLIDQEAIVRAFCAVCAEHLGDFRHYTAEERGYLQPNARAIANDTVRRVLATPADAGPKPVRMFSNAARVPWSPVVHLLVCPGDTRGVVRVLLMHFSRALGVHAGGAFTKAVFARVFAFGEVPADLPICAAAPAAVEPVVAPVVEWGDAWDDASVAPCSQASALQPVATNPRPGHRVRFQFMTPPCSTLVAE